MAKNELRETDETRQHAIKALRDWALSNPRILKTRLDSLWLLRFLRARKFSIPMAQEAIERYLVLKQGAYGKNWFDELNIMKPSILKLLDAGYVTILPNRTSKGQSIIFYRPGVLDPTSETSGYDMLTLQTLVYELLLDDEENQIRGIVHLSDGSGLSMSHFTIFSPQYAFRIGKNTEKTLAMRHKEFHIVNVHPSLKLIKHVILSQLPLKLRPRTHLYKNFQELKAIEKSNLPFEYGGKVPMRTLIENLKERLIAKNKFHLMYSDMNIDVDKYPVPVLEGSVKSLKVPLSCSDLFEMNRRNRNDIYGLQGSFRKLEID